MIDIYYQAPWLDNEGDFVFIIFELSHSQGTKRLAVGFCGFMIAVIIH